MVFEGLKNKLRELKEESKARRLVKQERRVREEAIKNTEDESFYNEKFNQAKNIGIERAKVYGQTKISEIRKSPSSYGAKGVILDLKKGLQETFGGGYGEVKKVGKEYRGRLGQRNIPNFFEPTLFSGRKLYERPQVQRVRKPSRKKSSKKSQRKQFRRQTQITSRPSIDMGRQIENNFRKMF